MELIFWIGIGVGSLIGLIIGIFNTKNFFNAIGDSFIGTLYGFFIALATWLFIGVSWHVEPSGMVNYNLNKRCLVAIGDGQSTESSGRFFLGVGSISGGGTAYWAYEELESNKYKQITFDPSQTTIIEDVDSLSSPYFIEIREKIDSVVFSKKMEWDEWMYGPDQIDNHIGWEIHIPKGSIVHDFNLDLK